jgi:predicted Zn finger-like uncharacterized protein
MKIVCDSCATKYSISDDKVRGKVFKIRCKKCSHIIVVRGTTDAAAAPVVAAPASEGGWHLVVDGEQVGPLPESEIRARIERGEINGETYIWKEGMADWLKLATVPDFSDSVPAPAAGEAAAGGVASDLFSDSLPLAARDASQVHVDDGMVQSASLAAPAHGGGLFGAIDAANNAVVSSARVGRSSGADHGGDLFASHAVSQNGSEDGRRPAAAHDGGRVENLTAQRHENSVLFSLANLQQLAMPSAVAPKSSALPSNGSSSQSEGSGLIDIRAMAASTMGSPAESRGGGGAMGDDLPTFGSFSAAAPVLLPIPSQSGPPKWIYAVIAFMVLLVFGIGVMAYKILTTKPVTVVEQVPIAAPPPAAVAVAAAPKPVAPAVAGTPTTPAIPDDKLPPREGEAPKAAAEAGVKHVGGGKKPGKIGGKDKEKKGATPESGGKATATVAAPAPEPEKKAKPGSLDDLLEGALSGKKTRSRPSSDDDAPKRSAPSASAEPAGPLSKTAVVSGMNSIKPKINECYSQFKVAGMAMVNVVIGKNGRVSAATVSGKFAGTPSGLCVEKAVKSATFPPSEGLTTPYPFQLK